MRIFLIMIITVLITFGFSSASFGDDMSLSANLYSVATDKIYNLEYENYTFYPIVIYFDCYSLSKEHCTHVAGIWGLEYFYNKNQDRQGLYTGIGFKLLTGYKCYYPEDCNQNTLDKFDWGMDLRLGYRQNLGESLYWDLGYSTRKNVYANIGVKF